MRYVVRAGQLRPKGMRFSGGLRLYWQCIGGTQFDVSPLLHMKIGELSNVVPPQHSARRIF